MVHFCHFTLKQFSLEICLFKRTLERRMAYLNMNTCLIEIGLPVLVLHKIPEIGLRLDPYSWTCLLENDDIRTISLSANWNKVCTVLEHQRDCYAPYGPIGKFFETKSFTISQIIMNTNTRLKKSELLDIFQSFFHTQKLRRNRYDSLLPKHGLMNVPWLFKLTGGQGSNLWRTLKWNV